MQIMKQSNCSFLQNKVKYKKEIQFDFIQHVGYHIEIHGREVKAVREQVFLYCARKSIPKTDQLRKSGLNILFTKNVEITIRGNS